MTERPTYRTSKRAMWISGGFAWSLMFIVVIGAFRGSAESVAIAGIVIPTMAGMIVAMLGLHRAFGSLDFRALNGPRPRRQNRPRADPPPEEAHND